MAKMDAPVEKVFHSLQRLLGLHRQLHDNVRMERDALVSADLKGIQDATFAKQALIEGIQQAEAARMKATAELALFWKRPWKDLTLPNLIITVQGTDLKAADQFRSCYNALTILIKRITELNLDNQELVARSLTHVTEMKSNALGQTVPKSNTYNPQGQKTNNVNGARLLSKEA